MSVSREDVAHFAALAKLDLSDVELDGLTRDLNDVLDYVETLQESTVGSGDRPERGRDDSGTRPEEGVRDELAFGPEAMAPRWEAGHFVVPPPPGVQAGDASDA